LTKNLEAMSQEYPGSLNSRSVDYDNEDHLIKDFTLRSRRLVHLGEVSYKENSDPLSLAVSQTFKIEKSFSETDLGCTQAVADAIRPTIVGLNLELEENKRIKIPGIEKAMMTYYVKKRL
jgi:hypothetical protein